MPHDWFQGRRLRRKEVCALFLRKRERVSSGCGCEKRQARRCQAAARPLPCCPTLPQRPPALDSPLLPPYFLQPFLPSASPKGHPSRTGSNSPPCCPRTPGCPSSQPQLSPETGNKAPQILEETTSFLLTRKGTANPTSWPSYWDRKWGPREAQELTRGHRTEQQSC